jgi:hypothetical protein
MPNFVVTHDPPRGRSTQRHYWYAGSLVGGGGTDGSARERPRSFGAGLAFGLALSLPFWLVVALVVLS